MRVKNKYNYDYTALNLKTAVVEKFRSFTKQLAKAQSDTLSQMIDFFVWHRISPFSKFGLSEAREHDKTRSRVDAVIAIIRDIEKNHDKPNTAMLQLLFEGSDEDQEQLQMDQLYEDFNEAVPEAEITTVLNIKYEHLQTKMLEMKNKFETLLDQIEPVSNRFGKDYLKVALSIQEWKKLKRAIKKM